MDVLVARRRKANSSIPVWHGGSQIVEQDGYQFMYADEGDSIFCLARDRRNICFKIDFDDDTVGIAIGYFNNCSINKDLPPSTGTKAMLKAILQLVFEHPNIRNFRKIVINDNATVPMYGVKIYLANMFMLCTGCTWYSTLAPMFPERLYHEEVVEHNRLNMFGPPHTEEIPGPLHVTYPLSFGDLIKLLPSKTSSALLEIIADMRTSLESEKSKNAADVLNVIRLQKKYSMLFHDHIDNLLRTFNVTSQVGMPWCIAMEDGKILAPENDEFHCLDASLIPQALIKFLPNEEYAAKKAERQHVETDENLWESNIAMGARNYNPSSPPPNNSNVNSNFNMNSIFKRH